MGKENLYVWEKNENMLHEDEAAEILREICQGEHMHASQPKEDVYKRQNTYGASVIRIYWV